MMPVAAIPLRYGDVKGLPSFYSNRTYSDSLKRFGIQTLPVLPGSSESFCRRIISAADGLLLTGGRDISPDYYGQPLHPETVPADRETDLLDFMLLDLFVRSRKPVLGICRGLQVINVFFGGTLCQHLPDRTSLNHKQTKLRDQGVHPVLWHMDVRDLCSAGSLSQVNSLHHQGIDTPAPGFEVLASSPDGLAECIRKDCILGVQWHPEELGGQEEERIFQYFYRLMLRPG